MKPTTKPKRSVQRKRRRPARSAAMTKRATAPVARSRRKPARDSWREKLPAIACLSNALVSFVSLAVHFHEKLASK